MKYKYYIVVIVVLLITGCSGNNQDSSSGKIEDKSRSIQEAPESETQSKDFKTFNELSKWMISKDSKGADNETFEAIKSVYQECGYLINPTLGDTESSQIFIDSNFNFIHYMFSDPSIRVCIEPITSEDKDKYNTLDVAKYMKEKFDITFNIKESIGEVEDENAGYEYDTNYATVKNIQINDGKKTCVYEQKFSEKNDTMNILTFIEENMLVRIIYYDLSES